jgi:hypothetical protein
MNARRHFATFRINSGRLQMTIGLPANPNGFPGRWIANRGFSIARPNMDATRRFAAESSYPFEEHVRPTLVARMRSGV